jgi:[acyl-carrier-protein] S-malonyltransferase
MKTDFEGRRCALVFPGVGVRLCGAETAFFDQHREVMRPLFREASYYCDVDLIALLFSGGIDALPDDKKQYFTYAFSAGAADVALRLVDRPVAAAGYSFGIYAALYATAACSFSEGLFLIDKANQVMQSDSAGKGFGMGVVVGLTATDIGCLLETGGYTNVMKTNVNHDHCYVFSGTGVEIDAFLKKAEALGAFKFERLDVDIPYHHPMLLAGVSEAFRVYTEKVAFRKTHYPIVSTIDGDLLSAADALVDFVSRHPTHPINWRDAISTLHRLRVNTLFECGPGISLSQNGRFLPFEMTYINVKKTAAWLVE